MFVDTDSENNQQDELTGVGFNVGAVIVPDDQIVIGGECIGQDCVNGEDFSDSVLKLKENNLRIRFHDTSIGDKLGENWHIEANSSRNGGFSYLDLLVQSAARDTVRLVRSQDGPVPNYDCTTSLNGPINDPPSNGTLTIGNPFIDVQPIISSCVNSPSGFICDHSCDMFIDYDQHSVLTFGTATATPAASFPGGVAIGYDSALEDGVISVGTSSLARRIAHIADGINATDALIKGALDDYTIVNDQQARADLLKQQITDLNTQLDNINQEIDFYLDPDDDDDLFSDIDEMTCGTDPRDAMDVPTDTDGDGLCDNGVDPDDDNDLFSDVDEGICGTDPLLDTDIPTDTDSDGLCDNGVDDDDDGDGVLDVDDAFPLDATESVDTDADGTGNNADTDDDNDLFTDADELICGTDPLSNTDIPTDTDGDGMCDNGVDNDDDNDGVADTEDAFPLDATEFQDTDNDGIGNNADTDDDNDGVPDTEDAFPLDPNESVDTDGDGTGNNADTDDDNDGVPDSEDAFPLDATESQDTDGDGIGNNTDNDDDGDGVNDSEDAFPLDANESVDTDGDGTGNNADTDDDNDGVPDSEDAFPLDPTESQDTDGDGIGNNTDNDDDNDGDPDSRDPFPLDASRKRIENSGGGSIGLYSLFLLSLVAIRKKYVFKINNEDLTED
ncbi:MAG: GlyGly-CTERM sorting domain-containing protein [Gammaproteobacteria bacterium]|nr:GlyGly-CTERM sorting domain-containing protein [Gammaproteobacteria bacterium]